MDTIRNKTAHQDKAETVALNVGRDQARQRLAGLHQSLEKKGMGAAFLRVARPDPIGDMGFLSGLIIHMMCGGILAELMDWDDLHETAVAGGSEALSLLRDKDSYNRRGPKLNAYPEGRRAGKPKPVTATKKFNMAAANQNRRSTDVQSELGLMFEVLAVLDSLESRSFKPVSQRKYSVTPVMGTA